MELEDQVCSLDLSKKLKALGVKQESLFYWSDNSYGDAILWAPSLNDTEPLAGDVSAFTAAELGEMLPAVILKDDALWTLICTKGTPNYCVKYQIGATNNEEFILRFHGETEADARAKVLIFLIENNLLTLKEDRKK